MYSTTEMEHPEQQENEVFMGNTTVYIFENNRPYMSKRLGITSYSLDGSLTGSYDEDGNYYTPFYPYFIDKDDFMLFSKNHLETVK